MGTGSTESEAGIILSPGDWEQRLVAHYLRSDGPSGSSALTFVDATPAELATASGIEGIGEAEAQRLFLDHFDREGVRRWLSGRTTPPRVDQALPTYFRYLLLTCLVSATETGAGDTRNFRLRLGELLGEPGTFGSVSAVNSLWAALARWCDRRREQGLPFRYVELPSDGGMSLIGIAVRIAFPSWSDRRALTRILKNLAPEVRRSPERLSSELCRLRYVSDLPTAVAASLADFRRSIVAKRRMLLGHRFWRLVQSIDARLAEPDRAGRSRWRLEARFGGYEQDEVEITLCVGRTAVDTEAVWEGGIEALGELRSDVPTAVVELVAKGVLVLSEAPGARWIADRDGVPEDRMAVLLVRRDTAAAKLPIAWRNVGSGWLASGRIDPTDLRRYRHVLNLSFADDVRLVDLSIEGGVKIDRGSWLGRPGFLPTALASDTATVEVEALGDARGVLGLQGGAPSWQLACETPLAGRWRVIAREADVSDRVVCFEAEVPERYDFPAVDPSFDLEAELAVERASPSGGRVSSDAVAGDVDERLWDALEAVYGTPNRGWPESKLFAVLRPVLPSDHFFWDFVRSCAEAGWLDPTTSKTWRARTWLLQAPCFVALSDRRAYVDGATGQAARRRLSEVVEASGGAVEVHAGMSTWAPPTLAVEVDDLNRIAERMGWPLRTQTWPHLFPAPQCWPSEPRSGDGRIVAGRWSFDVGLFLPVDDAKTRRVVEGEVSLERLVREKRDDRDLFRVTGRGEPFLTSSRTVAVLEAHRRRGEPLFDYDAGSLSRRARAGHLPLPIARALRGRGLRAGGPVPLEDGAWTYRYHVDDEAARQLAGAFGAAIGGMPVLRDRDLVGRMARARRAGRRPSWYAPAAMGGW